MAAAVANPARSECPAKSPSSPAAAARAATISASARSDKVGPRYPLPIDPPKDAPRADRRRREPAAQRPDRTGRLFSSKRDGDRRADALAIGLGARLDEQIASCRHARVRAQDVVGAVGDRNRPDAVAGGPAFRSIRNVLPATGTPGDNPQLPAGIASRRRHACAARPSSLAAAGPDHFRDFRNHVSWPARDTPRRVRSARR
jgi:hypothetical protein